MFRTLAVSCVSFAIACMAGSTTEEGVTVETDVLWSNVEEGQETRDIVTSEEWITITEMEYHLDGDEEDHDPHAHRITIRERVQHIDTVATGTTEPETPPSPEPPTPPTPTPPAPEPHTEEPHSDVPETEPETPPAPVVTPI